MLSAHYVVIVWSSLKLDNVLLSSLLRLTNTFEVTSISNNLSCRQLRCVSIAVSLILGLNEELSL